MTDTTEGGAPADQGLRRYMPTTVNGKCLAISFVICVVSSIFMAGILPVDNWFGAVGIASIYFVVMILLAPIIKMTIGRFLFR